MVRCSIDAGPAAALPERSDALRRWKTIYWDEFIPLAHGVRQLAQYYTDTVRPDDPYEFIGPLKSESMLATRRNMAMADLAATLRGNSRLRLAVSDARASPAGARVRPTPLLPEFGCIDDDGEDAVKGPPRSKAFAGFAEWGAEPRPRRRPGRQSKRIPGLVHPIVRAGLTDLTRATV